jgi:hypothetical protein
MFGKNRLRFLPTMGALEGVALVEGGSGKVDRFAVNFKSRL